MNYLKILFAIGLFLIGVPGLLDDAIEWQKWIEVADRWNIVFMIAGIVLLIHGVFKWSLREQISQIRAFIVELFTDPDWLVEARDKQSFKLFELACLLAGRKPHWPLPSDEAESAYNEILHALPAEIREKHLAQESKDVKDIELNRRQARECVPSSYWEFESGSRLLRKVYPRFIREEFDRVLPDYRTDEDDRKQIASNVD